MSANESSGPSTNEEVTRENQPLRKDLACLLWTSPAWKMAERDRWIGWTGATTSPH
ncbi:MAG: hypothetical protein DMG13_25210 [Acidobacteria bacterium]|nr:MAG: hypothetical protein DMG13_25210 [Acidobacteriota bacterium]